MVDLEGHENTRGSHGEQLKVMMRRLRHPLSPATAPGEPPSPRLACPLPGHRVLPPCTWRFELSGSPGIEAPAPGQQAPTLPSLLDAGSTPAVHDTGSHCAEDDGHAEEADPTDNPGQHWLRQELWQLGARRIHLHAWVRQETPSEARLPTGHTRMAGTASLTSPAPQR